MVHMWVNTVTGCGLPPCEEINGLLGLLEIVCRLFLSLHHSSKIDQPSIHIIFLSFRFNESAEFRRSVWSVGLLVGAAGQYRENVQGNAQKEGAIFCCCCCCCYPRGNLLHPMVVYYITTSSLSMYIYSTFSLYTPF